MTGFLTTPWFCSVLSRESIKGRCPWQNALTINAQSEERSDMARNGRGLMGKIMRGLGACALLAFAAHSFLDQPAHADDKAGEPPLCADETSLRTLRLQYESSESARGGSLSVAEINDIKETRYGPSPDFVNQYATDTTYATTSRFCAAVVALSDGTSEEAYWRMDHIVDGDRTWINQDHCSKRHDTFEDGCADYH